MEELEKVKEVLKSPCERPRHLTTPQGLVLFPTSEATYDGETLRMPTNPTGLVVIWCFKWNQGCFDLALFCNGQLVTLQFTTSATHSLKLQYVSQLRSALLKHGSPAGPTVFHWFVLKEEVLDKFKHDSPMGTGGRNFKHLYTVSVCNSTSFQILNGAAGNILVSDAGTEVKVHSNKKTRESEEAP